MYQHIFQSKTCTTAIAFISDQPHCIAAWGKNRCNLDDSIAELICIHSLQHGWGKGYGSVMIQYVLTALQQEGFKSVILWVFEVNTRARRFYEKHGFELTQHTKLTNGIAELMYIKHLL